ncbi:MAG TPA: metallophosphoesterase [Candidatus Dormibacteraeota bacterium]|nr:metallophosphoesterase [Candidatus Dormibacteraeota bacterium]
MKRLFGRLRGAAAKKGFRCYFTTDIHGSERCFRKFLAAARVYECDALILGGDVAGKAIVPMTDLGSGRTSMVYDGALRTLSGDELEAAIANLRAAGMYPRYCTDEERQRLTDDVDYRERLFAEVIVEQLQGWCALAAERLDPDLPCIITPGNDDPLEIDDKLRQDPRVQFPERELLEVGPITLASLGNTNPTPWNTAREFSEEELGTQIDQLLGPAPGDARLVLNFHCPPYASGLDTATKLDGDLRPVMEGGRPVDVPVGSTAVRAAIERYRPVVGLHGHIHESAGTWRSGGTVCLNPGSEYGSGVLKGALVQFDEEGNYQSHLLTTG